MQTSTKTLGSKVCGALMMLVGGLAATTAVHARADEPPEAAGSELKYFSGAWLCTVETIDGNDSQSVVGTLHFGPWDAWTVGSFTPQDSNTVANGNDALPNDASAHWPPHGGHGPVVHPPERGHGFFGNNLSFMTYDPVAKAYVSFKFLGTGTYAMASSPGPDEHGDWVWEGALSDDGQGTGALVRATMSVSDPNAFNAVGTVSTDVGQTWKPSGQVRCAKQ